MLNNKNKSFTKILVLLFWLLMWQLIANKINQNLLMASPISVIKQLWKYLYDITFWKIIFNSYFRIILGFIFSIFIGIFLSILSYKFKIIKILLNPFMATIKTIPVVSIIILLLVWSTSENLSVVISFFMTLPIIYISLLKGMEEVNKDLLEMAKIFNVNKYKKIKYIYMSEILPYFEIGGITALGIGWKSGIAAEVIGLPTNSIGEMMYESKIYFNTINLFTWAIVVILLGIISEKIFILLIRFLLIKIERVK